MSGYQTHFRTRSLPEPASEDIAMAEISELVSPGQLLVSTTLSAEEQEVPEVLTLEAGENTELDIDKKTICSTIHGYPVLSIENSGQQASIQATVLPLFTISDDNMEVTVNLLPGILKPDPPDKANLLQIFAQAGIAYGIEHDRLEQIIRDVFESDTPCTDVIIARGKAPINGRDAYLRMELEIGPLPGKLLANGTIDFRERQMFVGVREGQLLATKIPPEPGKPGINIFGEQVEAKDGKDITVKVTGDVSYNEPDRTVRAQASGVLSVVNSDTLRVAAKQTIEGDIDFSTGNIRSQNSVEIKGSVRPEFLVSAKGNLLIGGNVESASVKCRGNIDIRGGILGRDAQVHARGDIDAKYIERGSLSADGNIIIRTGCYYSSLQAGGSILCPETAKLIGGILITRGSVSAGLLGSPSASPMRIAVGVDPWRFRYYQELLKEYDDTLAQIQSMTNLYGQRVSQEKNLVIRLEAQLTECERKLTRLNLIPDAPEESLGQREYFHSSETIAVQESIAAGTIVRIGNDSMVLDRDYGRCTISMDNKSGLIVVNID